MARWWQQVYKIILIYTRKNELISSNLGKVFVNFCKRNQLNLGPWTPNWCPPYSNWLKRRGNSPVTRLINVMLPELLYSNDDNTYSIHYGFQISYQSTLLHWALSIPEISSTPLGYAAPISQWEHIAKIIHIISRTVSTTERSFLNNNKSPPPSRP